MSDLNERLKIRISRVRQSKEEKRGKEMKRKNINNLTIKIRVEMETDDKDRNLGGPIYFKAECEIDDGSFTIWSPEEDNLQDALTYIVQNIEHMSLERLYRKSNV